MLRFIGGLVFFFVSLGCSQELSEADVREMFRGFDDPAVYRAKIAGHFARLGDESFRERTAASKALLSAPVIPQDLLDQASVSEDPEIRLRAERLAESGPSRRTRVQAALDVIAKQKIQGLASPLMTLATEPAYAKRAVWEQALAATVRDEDDGLLRETLEHSAAPARKMAVRLLTPKTSVDDVLLAPRLKDKDADVRLEAGLALLNREDRGALTPLVELLDAPQFGTRWRASGVLRSATGQAFDYSPDAEAVDRAAGQTKWKTWVADKGKSAPLTLPAAFPTEIALFNGIDLSNWVAIDGPGVDAKKQAWSVLDGRIVCNGKGDGHLRTAEKYQNYQLEVTWRWPGGAQGDSGVFLHLDGADKTNGRRCLEAQLLGGKAGDFWTIGAFKCEVQGKRGSYSPRTGGDCEKPGEAWNTMMVKVKDGTVEVVVNGVEQNKATKCPKEPGYIGLQVERSPIEFGRVMLTPLD